MVTPPQTSWTLIRAAVHGDCSARDRFADFYRPIIATYLAARWRKPIEHADVLDGVQDVFVQFLRPGGALERLGLPRSPGDPSFASFVLGVTRNVAGTIERRQRRWRTTRSVDPGEELPETREATMSRIFDRAWVARVTREARVLMAERLLEGERQRRVRVLELRFLEAVPPREIASQLELTVEAVYRELRRAKADFGSALVEVMRRYHPQDSQRALEQRCAELSRYL